MMSYALNLRGRTMLHGARRKDQDKGCKDQSSRQEVQESREEGPREQVV
jgi:hypothetical protein